jgi:predicted nucleic acid-binding protein
MIFVDTSAFLAVLITDDLNHPRAIEFWRTLLEEEHVLLTNNYVLVESIVIIQKRLGLSMVRDFHEKLLPLVNIEWIDENQHKSSIRFVLAANRRKLSFVDCSSFETMRRLKIEKVFTFDEHFREQGFEVIP